MRAVHSFIFFQMLDQDVHQLKVINKSKEKEVEHLQEQIQGLEEEMRSRDERLKTVLVRWLLAESGFWV